MCLVRSFFQQITLRRGLFKNKHHQGLMSTEHANSGQNSHAFEHRNFKIGLQETERRRRI